MSRRKAETSRYFEDGRVRSGNDYAQIMGDVLRSNAFGDLPDYAPRVLLALAAQYRKANNGDLSLTAKDARQLGIKAEWRLRAGLELLEKVGLIETTRHGRIENGKGICSLYALGWRQIDPSTKYDQPSIVAVRAPMRWVKWARPDDWSQQVKAAKRRAQGKRSVAPDLQAALTVRAA